jgi:tRNA U34 5-methylaminomethyl-2-thiouridine-forming methyltransferase MnmC
MIPEENPDIPKFITTDDGSHSLFLPGLNETYHSRHGAVQESKHVFIESGLKIYASSFTPLEILEVGFGTGLNAWLSASFAFENRKRIHYTTLETFPLDVSIYSKLNFSKDAPLESQQHFQRIHECDWNKPVEIHPHFFIEKKETSLQKFNTDKKFHLVFYDAFGPPSQPEMWTREILQQIVSMMAPSAIFVTYCAKGQVRRDLEFCGLKMERLPGPPGKREMLRGTKIN